MRESADRQVARASGAATPSVRQVRDAVGEIDPGAPVRLSLRPGGLIEVRGPTAPIGFIDWVPPVFVAYVGPWPGAAAEAGQRRRLADSVELVRAVAAGSGP